MTDQPVLRLSPPPAFLDDPGLRAVLRAVPAARIVGGAVRDAVIGRPVADIDLATPDLPDAVAAALARAGIRAVPTGLAHGTITAVADGRGFQITTLRLEVETDGRHAVVAFIADWRADAARRDFTFNAMSMTPDGAVFDYFGGLADLRAGVVRFVGDPAARIAEDYLRILRFFRFHARFGTTPPDPATAAALRAGVPGLAGLSVERVWNELSRVLAAPAPAGALAMMAGLGVLDAIMPEGADIARLQRLLARAAPADPVLRLAALLSGDAHDLALRLKLSVADRTRLEALRAAPAPSPADDDAALRRMLADGPRAILIGRTWLAEDDGLDRSALRARLAAMPAPVFPLHGRDVVALGVPAGAAVGAYLRAVRAWWHDGGCVADAAACTAALRRQIRSTLA